MHAPAARPARPAAGALHFGDLGPDEPEADPSGGFSLELDPADAPVRSPMAAAAVSRPPAAPAVSFAAPRVTPPSAASQAIPQMATSQAVPRMASHAAATTSQAVPRMTSHAAATTSQAVPRMASQSIGRAEAGAFGALVRAARERGASDLHVSAARVTSIRVINDLVPLDPNASPLGAAAVDDLLLPLLDDSLRARLDEAGYVDFALEAPGGGRLRANISRQQQGLKGTFRLALAAPATLEQLGLPADLAKVVHHHQGLVIVAGPSGQGKTTTLAALVDMLNSSRPYHILTIEDPVEIVHQRKQAVISQRETGRHTTSFARGLKASLREDPDVIVIGELRDRESVEIALTAAETGHLVIATMSTPSASKTIDRLIDMFPPEEHNQVRASIAGALRAIVAQRLLPKRGGGVVPAIELVTGVLPLAVLIREDKLYQLPNLLQRGRAFGMIRFDESLAEHVRAGRVEEEAALAVAESRKDLAIALHPPAPAAAAKTTPIWGFGKKEQR
jgi:twitching motility protein PilT